MFEVEFYEGPNGKEPIKGFIIELQTKGKTSKSERIRSEKILTYIRVLKRLKRPPKEKLSRQKGI